MRQRSARAPRQIDVMTACPTLLLYCQRAVRVEYWDRLTLRAMPTRCATRLMRTV